MITKRSFGFTAKGEEVFEYQLTDGKMTVCVLTYGCVVNKILVPNASFFIVCTLSHSKINIIIVPIINNTIVISNTILVCTVN